MLRPKQFIGRDLEYLSKKRFFFQEIEEIILVISIIST